jgi:hypothetical protein
MSVVLVLRVQFEDREDQPERGPRVRVLLTGTEPGHQTSYNVVSREFAAPLVRDGDYTSK